ncbi:MAG: hypothetical protein LBC83_03555 [Oscillospiraceae bacterium]|jgi:hypothetical protein|nr:hypothetical protein [Oscillospiraceae bacterium]
MTKAPEIGHVVFEATYGMGHVKICDDAYRSRTPEEIEETLRRCAEIVMESRLRRTSAV